MAPRRSARPCPAAWSAAPSSVSKSLTGLSPNTTYYAQIRATNSLAVAGESIAAPFTTPNPAPVFTASVNTDHIAPDIVLSFTGAGWGEVVTRITVDTDPRVSPVRGTAIKVLDWSEASFDSGSAPTRADFVARPEGNSDLKGMHVSVRNNCLYVSYVSVRFPTPSMVIFR